MLAALPLSWLAALLHPAAAHGNMVWPPAWWDSRQAGWYWDEHGSETRLGCGELDLPDTEYSHEHNGKDPDCMAMWFSNGVRIPGKATLGEKFSQPEVTCTGQAGAHDDHHEFPWWSPGTAPSFSPCGALGGQPDGCAGDGKGELGDCCSGNCDTFGLGLPAEEYHWHSAPSTEWKAGSYQEVAWYCSANHAGGYSYRLCKLPGDGISALTEECFQAGQLDFVSDQQWVQYGKDRKTGHRTELTALQTDEGTFPAGSQWRANPLLPHKEEGGSSDYGHGHIIDSVAVPANLQPGHYVLSFRWDSKCSPQVWNSCSNIHIVA